MFRNLVFISFLLMLAACGGTTSTTPTDGLNGNGQVSVIVTDDLTLDYSEVWVTLYAIQAKGDNGEVTLFENKDGEVINLAELNGVGSLLSVASIPAGTYTSFEVKLAPEVNLVALDGSTETRSFVTNGSSGTVSFEVNGELVVADGAVASFALDFDLSNFIINADGMVVPKIVHVKDMMKTMKQTMAKLTGEITAVSDTGFTLHTADGTDISVTLNDNAIMLYDDGLSLDMLETGMTVKVFGSYDPDTLSIEAIKVVLKSSGDASMDGVVEVKGIITAITDNTFTINLKDAEYMPGTDSIDVTINDLTRFARGSLDILAVDQVVEVKGMLESDGSLTAQVIEIEGAGKEGDAYHAYGEIKGTVVSLTDNTLVLTADKVCGLDVAAGSEYSVDITDVFIKHGSLSDVVAGATVEVKGALDDMGQFHASILEIDSSDMGMGKGGMGMPDQVVFGTVSAIDTTSLTVTVTSSTNLPMIMVGDTVTVALTADTVFSGDVMPVVDNSVEIHVTSTMAGIVATEVSVDSSPAPATL